MRLLVNLVLVTVLVPAAGAYAQATAVKARPVEVTRVGAATAKVLESRLSGLSPEARSGILASIRRVPEIRSAKSVEEATRALKQFPELAARIPSIESGIRDAVNSPSSTVFDGIVKNDAAATMAALGAIAGNDNCSLRQAAQEGGAVSLSEEDRKIAFEASESLASLTNRSEFFAAVPSDSIVELNKTLEGLDINKDPALREGSAILVKSLNEANSALVEKAQSDGVVTPEEARKIADCQVIEAGKRIAASQGLAEANGIQMGVELAQACNFGDSLSESADKAAIDAYIAQCN